VTVGAMNETSPQRNRVAFFVVLAFAVVVLAIPTGSAPIWEPNDARWVLLARDMVEHGHWLMPDIRGVPNEGLYKPQLFSWSIALASLPSGHVSEFTAALPSIVSAIAGVAGVIAIGSLLWGVRAGAMAGLVLATTPNYFVFAHRSLADVMMTAFMVWALYFLLRARRDGDPGSLFGFYACLGGAMLSKGPPGLAAVVAAGVATWLEGGRSALQKLRPALGALILVVLALPWVVPYLIAARPAFVHEVLIGEYAQWFLGTHGLAYRMAHMPSVLLYFLPWTLFLPAAVVWWRRSGRDDGRRYVLWWTITLWTLVGLSGIYRDRYYLPVYPGLAILAGEFFARAVPRVVRRESRLGSIAFVVMMIALLIAMVFPPSLSGEGPVYMPDVAWERVLIGCLAAIGAVGVVFAKRRDTLVGLGVLIALVVGATLAIEGHTSPARRARYYDVPTLGAVATAHTPPDAIVFGYPDLSLEYDVYVRRRIVEIDPEELVRLLAKPSRDVVIMTRRRWAALASKVAPAWHVLESRTVGGVDIVVVGGSTR
jgi:4-amino-4-deoxy-L-arabinose transferase-like glycosyltransferase